MPEYLHHQQVQVGEPLGKIIPLGLGDLLTRLLGGKMVKSEHQAAEKLDLMGHIAQGPHRAAAFLDASAVPSLRLKVVQPLLDGLQAGLQPGRQVILAFDGRPADFLKLLFVDPPRHSESPCAAGHPGRTDDAAIHQEVQMDSVDFPTVCRAALPDQGWTPLRDAIAAVLKPLHARIVRAAGSADPAAEPRLDVAPESWLPTGHDYCDRLMAEIRQSAPAPEPEPEAGEAVDGFELINPAALLAEADRTARTEPATVAEARDMISDPAAALLAPELHRQVAWLVALADLRHRRATAALGGRTVA